MPCNLCCRLLTMKNPFDFTLIRDQQQQLITNRYNPKLKALIDNIRYICVKIPYIKITDNIYIYIYMTVLPEA